MVIACQVACYEVGTLGTAHGSGGSRGNELLAVDFYNAVCHGDNLVGILADLLGVGIPALLVARMVGRVEDFTGKAAGAFTVLLDNLLPYGSSGTDVVAGVGYVLKGQLVSLTLLWLGDVHGIDVVYCHAGTDSCRSAATGCCRSAQQGDRNLLLVALQHVVLLAVCHLMPQHDGDFVIGHQQVKDAGIDGHVVAQGAGSIEAGVRVDVVVVRHLADGRVHLGNTGGEVGHDGINPAVQIRIVVDPLLVLHLLKECLTAFLGIVELAELVVGLRHLYACGNNRAQHAGISLGRHGCQRHAGCQAGDNYFCKIFLYIKHFFLRKIIGK